MFTSDPSQNLWHDIENKITNVLGVWPSERVQNIKKEYPSAMLIFIYRIPSCIHNAILFRMGRENSITKPNSPSIFRTFDQLTTIPSQLSNPLLWLFIFMALPFCCFLNAKVYMALSPPYHHIELVIVCFVLSFMFCFSPSTNNVRYRKGWRK